MLADQRLADARAECGRVLQGNWREGVRLADGLPYAYTCPSPGRYPFQWYWDSCFAAVSWRRFDPGRSQRELGSLLAAQREDGFIGHTVFWGRRLAGWRRYGYNVLAPGDPMTATIQPPALAWAWRIAVGDPAGVPQIVAHHDWLERHRDLEGDGLIWIVQPDESGLDASPQFDRVWGSRSDGRPGFVLLVRRNRQLGFDAARIAAAGGPVCCEVMTNVLYSLSRMALGRASLTRALIERCYDETSGLFRLTTRGRLTHPSARAPVTWAALAPLALPDLPEPIARRLVEEHLLAPRRFWLPVPPPSVAAEDPAFSTVDRTLGVLRRYWRGPTWINAAWLAWLGLVRLGYEQAADELTERIGRAVTAAGLREYYEPFTGEGMGASDFAWSTLVLELLEPDVRAAGSYVLG
ncbi:MAG: MGH1-like glycoside hydrolase domain-containing protein [Solirubrobacteraceae bacterium]